MVKDGEGGMRVGEVRGGLEDGTGWGGVGWGGAGRREEKGMRHG